MKKYVGVKLVEAEPMTEDDFHIIRDGKTPCMPGQGREGYLVVYPDGYKSWSPKEVFEDAYFSVGNNNTITEYNVNEFIQSYDVTQWGDKTTIVHATLTNGFIISEASSCVDPENFNMDIGASICKERIQNKVWGFLGFMLQSAVNGVKRKDVK